MAGGEAYAIPGQISGQMGADSGGSSADSAPADEVSLLHGNRLAPLPALSVEDLSADLSGCQVHVRGIGADGWDGTPDGVGHYENLGALAKIFSPFGDFEQATVRHRIKGTANTSWALVTMANTQSVDAILKAHEEAPIYAGSSCLVLNRFNKKTAKNSTGIR